MALGVGSYWHFGRFFLTQKIKEPGYFGLVGPWNFREFYWFHFLPGILELGSGGYYFLTPGKKEGLWTVYWKAWRGGGFNGIFLTIIRFLLLPDILGLINSALLKGVFPPLNWPYHLI